MGSPYLWNVFIRMYQVHVGLLMVTVSGIYGFLGHDRLENVHVIFLLIQT